MARGDSGDDGSFGRRVGPRSRPTRRTLLAGGLLWGIGVSGLARAAADPVIAAAASFRPALDEIVAAFAQETGGKVRISYGATGALVRQIELGAPFELILAADAESVARLVAGGHTDGPGRELVRGRIVLAVRRGAPLDVGRGLSGLGAALDGGRIRRFAIANPELAPYGRAAREALTRAGLWPRLDGRLAVAENIGQAAQFVASGAAEAGVVALSSVRAPELRATLAWSEIPEGEHAPITQHMAVLARAGKVSRAFAGFLDAPASLQVFERAGFAVR